MALAVFFLLVGVLFAEIGMIGPRWANLVGAACLTACALTLATLRSVYESRGGRMSPTVAAPPVARDGKAPSSSVTALRST